MSKEGELSVRIKLAAKACPWPLLKCPRCSEHCAASTHSPHPRFLWCLELKCGVCQGTWHICTECTSQRKHLETNTLLLRHYRLKHATVPSPIPVSAGTTSHTLSSQSSGPEPKTFPSTKSQRFFEHNHRSSGLDYLVANAVFKQTNIVGKMDKRDTHMMIAIAHFVSMLTKQQRTYLATVLDHCTVAAIRQHVIQDAPETSDGSLNSSKKDSKRAALTSTKPSSPWIVTVPATPECLRATIAEGKHSIFANLPYPTVHVLLDHAFVLPSECVLDFFAHASKSYPPIVGLPRSSEELYDSNKAQSVVQQHDSNSNHIFLSTWSDDFEPNYAKGNRGSVWIKTVSLTTKIEPHLKLTHVYPIAVGKKTDNHEEIDRLIFENIKKFGPGRDNLKVYNGKSKVMDEANLTLLFSLMDQPERRGCSRLMLGGSVFHARWGFSIDTSSCLDVIRSCKECREELRLPRGDHPFNPRRCDIGSNWMHSIDHPKLKFSPPLNFPASESLEEKLKATRLDYDILKSAVQRCHEQVKHRRWNKQTALAYLSVYCLNTAAKEEIFCCAANCAIWETALEDNDEDVIEALLVEKASNPSMYRRWQWPPIWDSGLDLQDCCEAGMHILFLGVVERIQTEIQEWSKLSGRYAALRRNLLKLTTVLESLHLPWLKVVGYVGEKLGGWVAENYLGFCRVFCWMYPCIRECSEELPYVEPNKPQNKWTKNENQAWLGARGLPKTGNSVELRKLVSDLMESSPPPLIGPKSCPPVMVENMARATYELMAALMGMRESNQITSTSIARLTRVLLTYVDDFDTWGKGSSHVPIWVKAYNFTCLLNLEGQISKLGPVRNRWEGGIRGEGFLRLVKPVVQSTKRLNWHFNLLQNLLRQKTLLVFKEELDSQGSLRAVTDSNFVTYSSYAALLLAFTTAKPLSVVIVEATVNMERKTKYYAVYLKNRTKMMGCIQPQPVVRERKRIMGMTYCRWEMEEDGITPPRFLHNNSVTTYGVLLPDHGEMEMANAAAFAGMTMYTCIDMSWRQLSPTMDLELPHHSAW